jgi:hypothetical protein
MAEPEKSFTTTCKTGDRSKTYTTSGASKQEAREKAMVSAAGDGFIDSNCTTSEA